MQNKRNLKRTLLFFEMLLILAATVGLFALAWYLTYSRQIALPFYRKGNWLVIAVYAFMLYFGTKLYGGYRIGFYRVSEILYSQVLSLLVVNGLTYLQISLIGRQFLSPLPLAGMTVVQVGAITCWALWANRWYFKVYPPRKMVMIYNSEEDLPLQAKINSRAEKFNITEALPLPELPELLFDRLPEFEAVVLCNIDGTARQKIVQFCYGRNLRVYIVPQVEDVLLMGSEALHLFDTPLLLLRNRGLSEESQMAKRMMDLAVSLPALAVFLPLMGVIALCVKLYDGGPVLYKQKRLTKGGRVFEIYKFRSMVVDAEKDGVARLASQGDRRITPVGRVLRKLRLDELPQLFNIARGDMSLVGPRPERPEIAAQYLEEMPAFAYRLKVKAGLTGYAQIYGKYNTTPRDKLLLDLMYIESFSLRLDIKLLFMTVKALFWPESTQGVQAGQALPVQLGAGGRQGEEGQ